MLKSDHQKSATDSSRRILLAAKSEFAAHGFSGARLDAIARSAGVNKAMVHYYFGTKSRLYSSLLEKLVLSTEREGAIADKAKAYALNIPQRVYLSVYVLVHLQIRGYDPEFHKIVAWEIAGGREQLRHISEKYFIPRIENFERLIETGIAEGIFDCRNPLLLVWTLISQVVFYLMQHDTYINTKLYPRLYGEISSDDFLEFALELTFRGLSPAGNPLPIPKLPEQLLRELDSILTREFKERGFIQ